MLDRFIRWYEGYLIVYMKGYSPERFFNLCSNHNIKLWDVKKTEDGYSFLILLKDYLSLRPIVRKTKTIPYIRKRIGFPFVYKRIMKHKGFAIGVILAVIMVYIMSLYIWDIQISGQYSHTEEAIIKFLKEDQVYAGIKKDKLSCQKIEEDIRKRYSDIGWVSAEIRGTRLLIKITETNMPKPYEKEVEPCHIVASKDGIIQSILVRKGTPLVKIGDVVKKGTILVGGYINLNSDDGTVVSQKPVIADADIIMKSYYEYDKEFDRSYNDKVYTGKQRGFYSVKLFGRQFDLLNPLKRYDSYDCYDETKSEKNLKINQNFYLPLSVGKTEYIEYTNVKKIYTREEAIKKARKELDRYINALKENGVEILENNVTIEVMKKKCVTKGRLIVNEPVHTTKKVKESELIKEPPATPDPADAGN